MIYLGRVYFLVFCDGMPFILGSSCCYSCVHEMLVEFVDIGDNIFVFEILGIWLRYREHFTVRDMWLCDENSGCSLALATSCLAFSFIGYLERCAIYKINGWSGLKWWLRSAFKHYCLRERPYWGSIVIRACLCVDTVTQFRIWLRCVWWNNRKALVITSCQFVRLFLG